MFDAFFPEGPDAAAEAGAAAAAAAAAAAVVVAVKPATKMTVKMLQAELKKRGLDTKGRKAELQARIDEDDAAKEPPAEPPAQAEQPLPAEEAQEQAAGALGAAEAPAQEQAAGARTDVAAGAALALAAAVEAAVAAKAAAAVAAAAAAAKLAEAERAVAAAAAAAAAGVDTAEELAAAPEEERAEEEPVAAVEEVPAADAAPEEQAADDAAQAEEPVVRLKATLNDSKGLNFSIGEAATLYDPTGNTVLAASLSLIGSRKILTGSFRPRASIPIFELDEVQHIIMFILLDKPKKICTLLLSKLESFSSGVGGEVPPIVEVEIDMEDAKGTEDLQMVAPLRRSASKAIQVAQKIAMDTMLIAPPVAVQTTTADAAKARREALALKQQRTAERTAERAAERAAEHAMKKRLREESSGGDGNGRKDKKAAKGSRSGGAALDSACRRGS